MLDLKIKKIKSALNRKHGCKCCQPKHKKEVTQEGIRKD